MELFIIVAASVVGTIITLVFGKWIINVFREGKIGATTDDEKRVLMTVARRWRRPLLRYLRTLEANRELQDHIAANRQCLKEVRKYIKKEYGPL